MKHEILTSGGLNTEANVLPSLSNQTLPTDSRGVNPIDVRIIFINYLGSF